MLVISRKTFEKTKITTAAGEEIEVVVLRLLGNRVQLGFMAKESTRIMRTELLMRDDAKRDEGERAA